MTEIVQYIDVPCSERDQKSIGRLMVAAMFGRHEEVARRLQSTTIQKLMQSGAIKIRP